ncbi:MAG: hypothetical protein AB1422_03990 [bacterium]
MGYNLYLVKKENWFDKENVFTQTEWEDIQKYQISNWLYFDEGTITIKNPSKEQVIDFVKMAKRYNWFVQGDDGEKYSEDGSPIYEKPKKSGLFGGIRYLISELLAKKKIEHSMKSVTCPFKVGDKVKTTHRTGGVVIDIDPKANHGLGSIKVKFPDGVVLGGTFIAHGFEKEF